MPAGGPTRTAVERPLPPSPPEEASGALGTGAAADRSPPSRAGRPARRAGAVACALALAAIPTAVYVAVVLQRMTYAWDDFVQFGITLRFGIGRELLTYDLFEHFGPANRLTHGLLVTLGGLDTRWALAVALPVFVAYCLALVDLARVLGAGWGRVALGLAVTTVTAASVSLAAVLDQYLHVMVPVTAIAVATAAYVRWVRTRRLVHALTGALAVGLACAVQERGVFIVVFLALARVLVIEGGARPGPLLWTWMRTWLRDLPFLAVPILLAATTAVVVALEYVAEAPRGGAAETAVLVVRAWTEQLVPMVTGAYRTVGASGTGRLALVVLVNALVLVLLVVTVRWTAWNLRPWLLLGTWFALLTTFLGVGRLGIGTVEGALSDPQYCTYALPAVVVLIASVRSDRRDAAGVPRRTPWRPLLAQSACALVLGSLMVASVLPVAQRSAQFAPDYLDTSVQELLRANDRGATVVAPTRVPDALVPPGFFPYNSGELYLREADDRTIVDVDPHRAFFLDDAGRLTVASPVLLGRVEPAQPGSGAVVEDATSTVEDGAFCLSADGDGHLTVPLPAAVDLPGNAGWVRVVGHGDSVEGSVAIGGADGWSLGAVAPLTAEHGSVSFMVPHHRVSSIALLDIRAQRLCIEAVELWVLGVPGPAGCDWVGPSGATVPGRGPEDPLPCG